MWVFCNRRSSSSTAFQQHHPPNPGERSFFCRQDGATHAREAQTWSSRSSYRGRTAKCGEPFGWAGKFCALTNVSSKSLTHGTFTLTSACSVHSVSLGICSPYFRPTPLAVPDEHADVPEETSTQQQARMSASSATRELDELMASLSDFKVQSNVSRLRWYGYIRCTCYCCY